MPKCIDVKSAFASEGTPSCVAPGSGKTVWFKDCAQCPEMVVVPSGTVRVITVPISETLTHQYGDTDVAIPAPFAVGRAAVTFAQWDACAADGGCNGYLPWDNGWGREDMPVINVSFEDAQAYVAWLSTKTGQAYRLPTGAEREFATRAGSDTAYWWGDVLTLNKANVDLQNRSDAKPQDVTDGTANVRYQPMPVFSFEPNPWGLYNVHGNVWEWTTDCAPPPEFGEVPAESMDSSDAAEQVKPQEDCGSRLSRGGSWIDFPYLARSGASVAYPAGTRNYTQGFRVVRELR